jgi:ubiquinone/menaquinone biosynthesis C-methylase UbiE
MYELKQLMSVGFDITTPQSMGKLYDTVFNDANNFAEDSMFLNYGYWRNNPTTLDEACADFARLVGREAKIQPGDVVLDCGPGFGDQDFLWAREFQPDEIIGINVSQKQIEIASGRAKELGLADTVRYIHGSASELPRPDESVNKVVALESPFHFPSRREFFNEAFRVLKPGGRLVTADIIPLPKEAVPRRSARWGFVGSWARSVYAHGQANDFDASGYSGVLRETGFEKVNVYSIRDHVFDDFANFVRRRLKDSHYRAVHPWLRRMNGPTGVAIWSPWLDYTIAVAEK